MRRLAMLSAGLIAAAALASPAAAQERYRVQPHVTMSPEVTATAPYYPSGPAYYPTPRVGAFATAPWDNSPPPAYYGAPGYAAPGYY